ncbi:putative cell adhesion molecule [Fasciolopsis buskii]|uniref:Putative cell adhesion molecule n=1 Tax=Fasciolopsis buskii TaxID=27845 RepID=A0A8E0RQX5_9TREM|nr:putative cell adhesion molecule [Fasciolopsis buski]KAA0198088.1 putative cell adhesion molecule [Fasciolopsis buski]
MSSTDQRFSVPWGVVDKLVLSQLSAPSHPETRLRRLSRSLQSHTPPRITPDLPPLVRFFDRTGLQIQCLAAGHPRPKIRWFSLPTNGRAARADHVVGAASSDKLSLRSAANSFSSDEPGRSRVDEQDVMLVVDDVNEDEEEEPVSELGYNNYVR